MIQLLHKLPGTFSLSKLRVCDDTGRKFEPIEPKPGIHVVHFKAYGNFHGTESTLRGTSGLINRTGSSPRRDDDVCNLFGSSGLPPIQSLSKFPKEILVDKVVLVRFDSAILLAEEQDRSSYLVSLAIHTIDYLLDLGAKVILASDWFTEASSGHHAGNFATADLLSLILRRKVEVLDVLSSGTALRREALEKADIFLLENLSGFKGEVANCPQFAELLASGVDIYVNDAFSLSHKILASTIAVTRFCYGCVAGFCFEESLLQLQNAVTADRRPFVALIGGGNLHGKEPALKFLTSKCDGLIFVGMMSFQIMHAFGQAVPWNLLEHGAYAAAREIVSIAHDRNIPIICPKDFLCVNNHRRFEILPANDISDGRRPIDLGPSSLDQIDSFLSDCKKIIWIGPVKFTYSSITTKGPSKIAQMLHKLSRSGSDITVIGNTACSAITKESYRASLVKTIENASVVWEFLKGRKLSGIMALDRAYLYRIAWGDVYASPNQPLVVDIGSGNGLFIFGMAEKMNDMNFLGLEINEKVVKHCLDTVQKRRITNGFFIETNATSTFRSIVSSYPGKLVLVSIQCPNPDFNKPDHRWRMLQRSLVEAIADLLAEDGKVFIQSDVEAVALRMREELLKYSRGKLVQEYTGTDRSTMWLSENPFGVRSDWERHVLDRGKPMYRFMLTKTNSYATQTEYN